MWAGLLGPGSSAGCDCSAGSLAVLLLRWSGVPQCDTPLVFSSVLEPEVCLADEGMGLVEVWHSRTNENTCLLMKIYVFHWGRVTHDQMLLFGSENKVISEYLLFWERNYGIIWKLLLLGITIQFYYYEEIGLCLPYIFISWCAFTFKNLLLNVYRVHCLKTGFPLGVDLNTALLPLSVM